MSNDDRDCDKKSLMKGAQKENRRFSPTKESLRENVWSRRNRHRLEMHLQRLKQYIIPIPRSVLGRRLSMKRSPSK